MANDNRMELYQMGLNDAEIGRKVGKTDSAIRYWRKVNNLPSNYMRGHEIMPDFRCKRVRGSKLFHQFVNALMVANRATKQRNVPLDVFAVMQYIHNGGHIERGTVASMVACSTRIYRDDMAEMRRGIM